MRYQPSPGAPRRAKLAGATPTSPSWEVLSLVSSYLEPKTLARASCVSRAWQSTMSSDDVWQPICSAHYPSLSDLKLTDPSVPYHRLYAISYTAAKRRLIVPPKPHLSLDNLVFAINISALCPKKTNKNRPILNIAKAVSEVSLGHPEVFKLDIIDVNAEFPASTFEGVERVKVMWNVMLKDWKAVFTMIECEGKLSSDDYGREGWFSQELPMPGCCSVADASKNAGVVADLKLVVPSDRGSCKMTLGMMSIQKWSYVSVDYASSYLQYFLAPEM
ncbi:hypothetical protein Tsubulata_015102 [Turnera subulata]|uniref:F-box protein n=1 Tax=Turnera subulata TaxID=218843 RepID=A0A9Q0G8A1_9ROSI|nr:hypothetical protein Tsubulata_015102 [Turnera subulata]